MVKPYDIHLSAETEKLLSKQITKEREAEAIYLDMAIWADYHSYPGAAQFLYHHAEEERKHALRLITYLTELGKRPVLGKVEAVTADYAGMHELLKKAVQHEINVTNSIYQLVDHCLNCKDFGTFQFLQWFVAEQREEEAITRRALEIFETIGEEGVGRYKIDQALRKLIPKSDDL